MEAEPEDWPICLAYPICLIYPLPSAIIKPRQKYGRAFDKPFQSYWKLSKEIHPSSTLQFCSACPVWSYHGIRETCATCHQADHRCCLLHIFLPPSVSGAPEKKCVQPLLFYCFSWCWLAFMSSFLVSVTFVKLSFYAQLKYYFWSCVWLRHYSRVYTHPTIAVNAIFTFFLSAQRLNLKTGATLDSHSTYKNTN